MILIYSLLLADRTWLTPFEKRDTGTAITQNRSHVSLVSITMSAIVRPPAYCCRMLLKDRDIVAGFGLKAPEEARYIEGIT